jgi:outer membrane beta-barrel protein
MSKLNIKNLLVLVLVTILSQVSVAANTAAAAKKNTANTTTTAAADSEQKIEQEFDGLGGNGILLEKARALNPEVHTTVVQNRMVDRTNRFELSGEYANTFGGDTYVRTGTFGLNGQFHFTNRWSLGAKVGTSFNKLTSEGDDLVNRAIADHNKNPQTSAAPVPDIDYPTGQTMGYVNYYPLYGKISWLGKGISHFDVYGQLGYGTVSLKSGGSSAMSAGLGIGVWGNDNITTRLEMVYMDYTAKYYSGPMKLGVTSAAVQVGWLF